MPFPKPQKRSVTLREAFRLADDTLSFAHEINVSVLTSSKYATEAEQLHRLAVVGSHVIARRELEDIVPGLDGMRRRCSISKPVPATYVAVLEALKKEVPALSAITRDVIGRLPDFAAEVAQHRADNSLTPDEAARNSRFSRHILRAFNAEEKAQQVAQARAEAALVADKLTALPTLLAHATELVEAGEELKMVRNCFR